MPSFLTSSVCQGERPKQLARAAFIYRDALLSRMLSDRGKVRYLVAPPRFGKTYLACSYAQMVFGFRDTMWVNGQSSCFMRDLDAGDMVERIEELVGVGGLVVIDAVRELDRQRMRALWKVLCALVRSGREAIVTSTSANDPLAAHRDACVLVTGEDLLLDDDEFDLLRGIDPLVRQLPGPSCRIDRVPGLAVRDARARERFLADVLAESDPALCASLLVMLATGAGPLERVSQVTGASAPWESWSGEALAFVEIDRLQGTYAAQGLALRSVARAAASSLPRAARASGCATSAEFVGALAESLVSAGEVARAARLVALMAPVSMRAQWLERMQHRLLLEGETVAAQELYASLGGGRESRKAALARGSGERRAVMGDVEKAAEELLRVCRDNRVGCLERARAATAAAALPDLPARELDEVARVVSMLEFDLYDTPGLFAQAVLQLRGGMFDAHVRSEAPREELDQVAWVAAAAVARGIFDEDGPDAACLRELGESFAASDRFHPATPGLVMLRRALARRFDAARVRTLLGAPLVAACDELERRLSVQLPEWQHVCASARARADGLARARPARTGAPLRAVPVLRVQLFGRFCVHVGEERADESCFGRSKVRALMALLALNAGKDLSSEALAEALWPESTPEKARHNLYSTLSLVRRAISLPGGDCPYLSRAQNLLHLNSDMVACDAVALRELCRAVSYERLEATSMLEALDQMTEIYAGELLPGNICDQPILQERVLYRELVTDAAIAGTRSLTAQGELRGALRFARKAFEWDMTRDESCELLMGLQARCGQRSSATDTWRSFVAVLRGNGLDPSPEMQRVYLRILEGDDPGRR